MAAKRSDNELEEGETITLLADVTTGRSVPLTVPTEHLSLVAQRERTNMAPVQVSFGESLSQPNKFVGIASAAAQNQPGQSAPPFPLLPRRPRWTGRPRPTLRKHKARAAWSR